MFGAFSGDVMSDLQRDAGASRGYGIVQTSG
jgi:hypothetical protein